MISVEEALEKVLSYVDVLPAEERPILECLGQVLSEYIHSDINVPPLDNSAMDGYAVRSADTRRASRQSPRVLRVIDTVMAGSASTQEVTPGTSVRIMTGAPVPRGADSVVRFEDTDEARHKGPVAEVGIMREVKAGTDIRRAGEDVARGAVALRQGTVIRPSEVGVLASLGRSQVRVVRRPVVAILATGNELVDLDQPLPPGKIYNSNTYSIAAQVKSSGGIPRPLGIALDREDSMVAKLNLLPGCDMLLTSGGVSMGDYDVVKDILAKEGEIVFWQVRMKPGKPLAFGRIKGIPHLGFPGNPVSSMISFELFARPAILKMMGKKNFARPTVEAIIQEPVPNSDGRRIFARAIVEKRDGRFFASLTGPQGSGILTSMTAANGLAIIPEEKAAVAPGDLVKVMMLDWSGEI